MNSIRKQAIAHPEYRYRVLVESARVSNQRPSIFVRSIRLIQRELVRRFGPGVESVQELPEANFLSLLDFEINGRAFDPSSDTAISTLLQHFGDRLEKQPPAAIDYLTDLRIEPSKMSKQELLDRADRALENELHPSGLQPRTTSDGQIDWNFNPSDSREWLLMLNRHAWWPLWGEAYRLTGNEDYANAFAAQLADWIDKHPLPRQKSEHLASWRLMEAGLRMRVSWIPAFAYFYRSKAFDDRLKFKMLRAFYDHGQLLSLFYTNRNHLVRESNGLLALALWFPEFSTASKWTEQALQRLDDELRAQVNSDGSHIEMSTGYQWLTVDEFLTTKTLLDEHNLKFPTTDLDSALGNMVAYLAAVMRPDRSFPQLNDGFILWDSQRLLELGRQFGRSDIEYIGSSGRMGSRPDYCSRSFPNAGVHVMRSDWDRGACYSIFDTGPYGGPHGHEDKLSFELFSGGIPFIVDPGSYTYNKKDPYRSYFVGSQGHNTVMVDGGSQIRRWGPEHAEPSVNDTEHGVWHSGLHFDFASGQYDEGYAPFAFTPSENTAIVSDVKHRRDVIFAKPNFWIIVDSSTLR